MDSSNFAYESTGTTGIPDDGSWLDRRVLRREMTDSLNKQAVDNQVQKATDEAQGFLDGIRDRAQVRNIINKRSEETRRLHQEQLRQQAEAYRAKLRGYLRPELRD